QGALMAKRLILSTAVALLVAACMSQADTSAVEAAVTQFHDLQARGEDASIYVAATPEFRRSGTLENFVRFETAVRAVKGCSAPAQNPNAWNNSVNTSGHFIVVVYNRQCAYGPLVETFAFRVNGPRAILQGYNASG